MPIVKSSEDFEWNNMIAADPKFWRSPEEFDEMRKLHIQDVVTEPSPVMEVDPQLSEGEKKEAYKAEVAESKKEMKKEMKEAITKQFDNEGHPEMRLVKSKSKVPVFQDIQKQAEVCARFNWVVPGSFTQDPEKSGGTVLMIKCECGNVRTVKLCDAFHCKKCHSCKSKNVTKPKLDQQSTSGSDSSDGATSNT